MASKDFRGVCLDDLMVLEQLFSLNVYVYDLQETEVGDIAERFVRRSPYSYQETMNLNLYEDHFSYVNDMEKYSHSFLCSKLNWFMAAFYNGIFSDNADINKRYKGH